ncbi:MAG TPA: hypothetical protein VFV27_06325, partial [Nevskiaceae bacterium]|nr:hypothetical protein [Nevskiaceae bacterium]
EHWLREAQRASLGPRAFLHRQLGAGLAGQLEQQFQQLRQLNQRNATALALRRRQAEQGLHHLLGQRSPSPASAYGRGGQLQWQAGPRVLGVS